MPTPVVLLSPIAAQGGAERALVGVARHLPAAGFSPTAVLLDHGPLDTWFTEVDCPVVRLPAGRWRRLDRTASVELELRRLFRSLDATAVLANQSKGHIYAAPAARAAGVPEVWWQHGKPRRSPIELIAARLPTRAIVCANEFTAADQRLRTPRANVVTIPYGVATNDVAARAGSGADVRSRHGWERRKLVGIVGRLQRWKGQHVFVEAAAALVSSFPDVQFVIVGDEIIGVEEDYPSELRALVDRLGLGDRMFFAGHQPDVYPWFDALDIVVHASFAEPFGLVLVEAMALGKPVIAAAEGGPLEIIRDGVDGLLVPPGRPADLAAAIRRLLEDPALATELAQSGKTRAVEFSEATMARRWIDILREVVEGKPVRQPM